MYELLIATTLTLQVMVSHNSTLEEYENNMNDIKKELRRAKAELRKYKALLLKVQEDFRQKYRYACFEKCDLCGKHLKVLPTVSTMKAQI